jgi:hypothetical protein
MQTYNTSTFLTKQHSTPYARANPFFSLIVTIIHFYLQIEYKEENSIKRNNQMK